MEGRARFLGCCDLVAYLCKWACCWGCCTEGFGGYLTDWCGQMEMLKVMMVRLNAHDNLVFNLYEDGLVKLPIRVGTLDFHLINPHSPILSDTLRHDRAVVEELMGCLHYHPQKGIIREHTSCPGSTIEIYLVNGSHSSA